MLHLLLTKLSMVISYPFRLIDLCYLRYAFKTGKIPAAWLKQHQRNVISKKRMNSETNGENWWRFSNRNKTSHFIDFAYRLYIDNADSDILRCPITDDLKSDLSPLIYDAMPSLSYRDKALRKLQHIRHIYTRLLDRGVGGTEYETIWKRNLLVLDDIIGEYTESNGSNRQTKV